MPKPTSLWRSTLRILGLVLLVCGIAAGTVCWFYWDEVNRLVQPHWQEFARGQIQKAVTRYGKNLPEVDEVRLKLLHEVPTSSSDKIYELLVESSVTYYVIHQKTVTGEEARAIATLWRQINWDEDTGAGCHMPHHVVEFRHQGKPSWSPPCVLSAAM